jgi:hypothetical protein
MVVRLKPFIIPLTVSSLMLVACDDKGKGPQGSESRSDETSQINDTNPSDQFGEGDNRDGGSPSQPTAGSLSIDLSGVAALGIGEVDATSTITVQDAGGGGSGQIVLGLNGQTEKLLTKVHTDGSMKAVRFPDFGYGQPNLTNIHSVAPHGTIVVFGSRYFKSPGDSAAAWIKNDGTIVPFSPANYSDPVGTSFKIYEPIYVNDTLWINTPNQNSIWKFDFTTSEFARFTDDEQIVSSFVVGNDGLVVYSSRLRSAGESAPRGLRVLKPNGGLEEFTTPRGRNEFDNSIPLGNSLLIYSTLLDLKDDGMVRMRQLPIHASGRVSGREDGAFLINDSWGIFPVGDQPVALRVTEDGQFPAGNPFVKDPIAHPWGGTMLQANHTNVNRAQGLFFDGANLVKVSKSGTTYSSYVHKNLSMPTGLALQVVRVFGEDHGFSGSTYGALAISSPTHASYKFWWVEISKSTGVIDTENAKEILNPYSVWPGQWPQVMTIYKVGTTLVGLEQDGNGKRIFELTASGNSYAVQTTKSQADLGNLILSGFVNAEAIPANNHAFAAVYDNKLYYGVSDGLRTYNPSDNSVAWISGDTFFGGTVQTSEDNTGNCSGNLAARHVAAIVPPFESGMNGPAIVMRVCDGDSDITTPLIFARFTDWTFATGIGTNVNLTVSEIDSSTLRRFPEPFLTHEGDLTFVKRWQQELYVNSSTTSPIGDVRTTNMFIFGNALKDGSGIAVASDWTGNEMFISGKNISNQYRSYLINPSGRNESLVASLNGIQVYSATRLGTELLISGLRLSDNKKISAYVRTDGSFHKTDEQSNIKISKLVPFNPTNN